MNLSELIKECDKFQALIKQGDKWAAAKKGQVLNLQRDFIHNTPEEAVIALCKHEKV